MNFLYELNYTVRSVRRKFGFSILCVFVIALGYSITLPLYSWVKNSAYSTLPFADGERIVGIRKTNTLRNFDYDPDAFDALQFQRFLDNSTVFESIGAVEEIMATVNDGESTDRHQGVRIDTVAMGYTGIPPLLGRELVPGDAEAGADPVVVIGYELWQNRYSGSPDIIGSNTRINGSNHTIVGVMPRGFSYPIVAELWLPLSISEASEPNPADRLMLIAKLDEQSTRTEASGEVAAIMQGLQNDFPGNYDNQSAKVIRFTQLSFSNALPLYNSIGVVAIFIYLLVCLNVANLLLIRANERIGELAVRSAVGANQFSIFGHVLFESFFVCMAGAVLGIATSTIILSFAHNFYTNVLAANRSLPFWMDLRVDTDAIVIAFWLMLGLWVLSGVFAAWRAARKDLAIILGSESKGAVSDGGKWIGKTLVSLQVIFSFFLLVVSGSYIFLLGENSDESIVSNPERYISATISLNGERYLNEDSRSRYRNLLRQELQEDAIFQSMTFASSLPGDFATAINAALETETQGFDDSQRFVQLWVDPGYFNTLNIPLYNGRVFDSGDGEDSPGVVLVDEAFTQRIAVEEGNTTGRQLRLYNNSTDAGTTHSVIGLVPYIWDLDRQTGAARFPAIYRSLAQGNIRTFRLIAELAPGINPTLVETEQVLKAAAASVDRDVAIYGVDRLSGPIDRNNLYSNLLLSMFGSAALCSLVLSVIGVYGLLSRTIMSRAHEIGLRRAIGSNNRQILSLFLRSSSTYLLLAVLLGGGGSFIVLDQIVDSFASASSFGNLLSYTGGVFLIVTLLVGTALLVATLIPVRRVIRMEPGEALHYE